MSAVSQGPDTGAVTDAPRFPDSRVGVDPLLAVADLDQALSFWVELLSAAIEVQWDSYALLGVGEGHLHLAVAGRGNSGRGTSS